MACTRDDPIRRKRFVTASWRGAMLAGAAAAVIAAGPDEAVREARFLEAALSRVRGLVATFTQTVDSAALPRPQIESGTVYLLRPGRMRWEYDRPPGKLAIADGRRTYLYLPEERQAIVAPLEGDGAESGMSLLLRERVELTREFSISWGPATASDERRPLLLTPRREKAAYDHLLVRTSDDHLVRVLTVVDPLGSRITYQLDGIRLVDALDESLFRFEVPDGVDVQEIVR